MFTSNFSKHFKLNYHLQLILHFAARAAAKEFRNKTEEKIVHEGLHHHQTEAVRLMPVDYSSVENILSRREEIEFNPVYQKVS